MHARHVCEVGYTALWELELAKYLGYSIPTAAEQHASRDLPLRPFIVLGPLVIVRELMLNNEGAIRYREFRPRIRHRLRLAPASRWIT